MFSVLPTALDELFSCSVWIVYGKDSEENRESEWEKVWPNGKGIIRTKRPQHLLNYCFLMMAVFSTFVHSLQRMAINIFISMLSQLWTNVCGPRPCSINLNFRWIKEKNSSHEKLCSSTALLHKTSCTAWKEPMCEHVGCLFQSLWYIVCVFVCVCVYIACRNHIKNFS